MSWMEWLDYLTHPHSEQLIWVLIGVPIIVILLNYVMPQIMQWRDYRRAHPMGSTGVRTSKPKKKRKK